MPRLFVAIELPKQVKNQLADLARQLDVSRIRRVPAENIHVTLRFLGDCDYGKAKSLELLLQRAVGELPVYRLKLGALGAFPSIRRARVFWIGVEEGYDETIDVRQRIEGRLGADGFAGENRPYHPHATLARLKVATDIRSSMDKMDKTIRRPEKAIIVREVVLFESVLKPSGAQYRCLARVLLTEKASR